jgi:PAS domain S-box-containing protein
MSTDRFDRRASKTVGTVSLDEHWSPGEAEVILHQLANAFFQSNEAFRQNPEVKAAARQATRIRQDGALSEQRALTFAEDAVVIVDRSGSIRSASGPIAAIFGYDAGELTGGAVSRLFADPAQDLRSGVVTGRRYDGSTFDLAMTASEVTLFGASLRVLSLRDVSEAQRVEHERRKAEARFRTLVEQIPAVTFMASLEEGDNEIYIGPQIEALLGFTQKEWLDDPVIWFRQMHPDDQERWNAEFARGCAVGGPFRADCRFFARDGRTVWVHGEARVIRDENGQAQFIQGVAFDITEIKEAEERMREAQETLVRTEKLAAIGRLAASVGHELRNPLAAIRNAWFYLEKRLHSSGVGATDPRVAQFSRVIQTEIERSAKIIGELLDFSRERPLHRAPAPAPELVESALGVVIKPAETIRISADVPDDLPVPNVDADQVRQVLINLVQNAAEAVDPVNGTISVTAREVDGQLSIQVKDNGKGMSPEVQARIFEPLYTTKLRGTGLGLAIVDGIIKRHGGVITVSSEIGWGTTFSILLPFGEASLGPAPDRGGAADLRSA